MGNVGDVITFSGRATFNILLPVIYSLNVNGYTDDRSGKGVSVNTRQLNKIAVAV